MRDLRNTELSGTFEGSVPKSDKRARLEVQEMMMKSIMTWAGFAVLAAAFAGSANAQTESALGETSLRPMDIACHELMAADEAERPALVYFIAGYQAAQQLGSEAALESAKMTADENAAATGPSAQPPAEGDATAKSEAVANDLDGEVTVERSFFSMPLDQILKACENTGTISVAQAITEARSGLQ